MPGAEIGQKRIYDGHAGRQGRFKGDETAAIVLRIMKPYVAGRCLDIGAGSGALVRALQAKGYDSAGVDIAGVSKDIIRGSVTGLPFGSETFDTLFCCDAIEHLTGEQLDAGLEEAGRVLKAGGHFIVTTPFDENLRLNEVSCPECGHEFHRYGHLQTFDTRRIKEILGTHRLKVIFLRVYALGAMAKLPLGRYLNRLFLRWDYDFVGKSIVLAARKSG